jgi:DNA-directed RNA polymerase beta' subunit
MTVVLTSENIENILDFIKPAAGIPFKSAISIVEISKRGFRKQLEGQMIYPQLIPQLKENLRKTWQDSLIQAGESVGIICAQSIGEKNTQTALNTFHKAGQSEKTMTEGVPRFQELLNATRNPKMVNHKIYFNKGTDNIKNLRLEVGSHIVGCTFSDLTESFDIILDKTEEVWYKIYKLLYSRDLTNYKHCICARLNKKKMFEYKLTEQQIANVIEDKYDDLVCVFSPHCDGVFYIYADTTEVLSILDGSAAYVNEQNAIEIYLEDVVQPNLEKLDICGIPGVTEIFYTVENKEWFVETNADNTDPIKSNNFNKILALSFVDETRTSSNNIWEIYETLGVEAVKQFLIEEFMVIMDGINVCHAKLLVNRMTYGGSVDSISRYTLKSDECGPMGKASFEESLDNFLNAASAGEVEPTRGVSASIICGKRSNAGTGMMGLVQKLDQYIK